MIDENQLNHIIIDAFEATNVQFHTAIYNAFESEVYAWDGTITFRSNGEIVGSPRDIDDTGVAKNSQQKPKITVDNQGLKAEHINNAPHIHDVVFGYETDSGIKKPGRDPYEEALNNIDLAATMASEIRKRIS